MSGYTREEVISAQALVLRRPRAGGARAGDAPARDRRRVGAVRGRRARARTARGCEVEMRAVPILYRGQPHALGMARDITADAKRAASSRRSCARRSAWRRSATSPAASRTTSTTCSPRIMGYIVLASEREAAAARRQARRATSTRRSPRARQARDLIQQMLTFSRGQRGSPRPLALADAVRRVAQAAALLAAFDRSRSRPASRRPRR